MHPTTSIITITLARPSLAETCASVDAQTFKDWHHYVIGDGVSPTDYGDPRRSTIGFSRALGAEEPAADMLLGTPNPLFRWALNHLDLGRFVCFLDDDNCYEPEFLSIMINALERADTGIALCALTFDGFRASGGRSLYRLDDDSELTPLDGYPECGRCDNSGFLTYSWMAREVGFGRARPDGDAIQDYIFIRELADRFGWIQVPKSLVRYGVGPNTPPPRERSAR